MDRQVHVAELEPVRPAQLRDLGHRPPAFPTAPPAPLPIDPAGQPIHDGIEVGADRQPEVNEIITRIADDRQLIGGQDGGQSLDELGAPHTAAERRYFHMVAISFFPAGQAVLFIA